MLQGQLGRVAVIGGSEDYTGAPYFSAMASAKLGCDMVSNYRYDLDEETSNSHHF
jgi:NAD(P)H-hydrate repair Nnr-like enzyme with NAD(P)H-hydrate dehydratase domain